jgi:DNA-binding NarL/FixJ family response regulator
VTQSGACRRCHQPFTTPQTEAVAEPVVDKLEIKQAQMRVRNLGTSLPRPRIRVPHALQPLTEREILLVLLIIEGLNNREMGERLGTSEQVVKNWFRVVFDKTSCVDRVQLVVKAFREGWVE